MEGVTQAEQFFEMSPDERIQTYLHVISTSTDPEEVRAVDNLYSDVFNTDPPGIKSWEDCTSRVALLLDDEARQTVEKKANELLGGINSKLKLPPIDAELELPYARFGAVTHLVRSMVQGNNNFPIERFGEVIDKSTAAIMVIDPSISREEAQRYLKAEVKEVWEPYRLQEDEEFSRAAEAYRLVSSPREYKRMKIAMSFLRRISLT